MRYAVIIAGGAGTRLWPLSRSGTPKQLIRFIAGDTPLDRPRSLLHLAASRTRGLVDPQGLYVCTGAAYEDQILDELAMLPKHQILGEPMGRDTANAVGFAAAVLAQRDPDATMAVLTADHVITPIETFQSVIRRGFEAVEKHPEYLVTFGITPTFAATGYGYVQRAAEIPGLPGVHKVLAFREKPDAATAEKYVASGDYAWNSGMFVWKAKTILEQLKAHLPQSYEGLMKIAAAWDTPKRTEVLNAIYPTLPKISIDFAVMEKAPHVATIAMPVQWLDVGSWTSFGQTLAADTDGNRNSVGKSATLESKNILSVSDDPNHLIATIGMSDTIVIHTKRATLVCAAKDAEKIKAMVAQVEKQFGKDYV